MANRIHNLDTRTIRNASGEFPALVMGLDVDDPGGVESFLDEVVERFKSQRMCSPPETANMTVTLTGPLCAAELCARWRARASEDPVLGFFMARMVVADVLHIRGRELLDHASLIHAE